MRSGKAAAALLACVIVIVFSSAAAAQDAADTLAGSDPVVTFSAINDAVPTRFFDAETTHEDPENGNRLIIGFNTGLDFRTWKARDFRASTASFSHGTAVDTISFRIDAPAGYYISRITYTQNGTGTVYRTGKASGGSNWVIGDYAADLGQFGTTPMVVGTVDLTGRNLTSVPVSITTSLFAFSTPLLGFASVAVTNAYVTVELAPLSQ